MEDAAFANPPFFDDAGALRGPAPERRAAWMADDGLAAWIGFLSKAVREGGYGAAECSCRQAPTQIGITTGSS